MITLNALCSRALIIALSLSLSATIAADTSEKELVFVKQNSKPKYFDDNQEGLCGEIYIKLQSRLKASDTAIKIDPVTYPIKRVLSMLDRHEADVFCGAGRNKKREKLYLYSKLPVYSVGNVVSAKRQSSIEINDISDIAEQNLLVGALFGTTSATFLKSHEGVRVNDKFHTVEEGLETLAENEHLHLFYYHDLGLNYLTRTLGLPIKVLPVRFRETPQWLLYSKETPPELVESVDLALKAITESGELKAIQRKYLDAI